MVTIMNVYTEHNLLDLHVKEKPLPLSAMKTYTVPKGMVRVFTESLIHAGGATSMTLEEYNRKKSRAAYTTDQVFQETYFQQLCHRYVLSI